MAKQPCNQLQHLISVHDFGTTVVASETLDGGGILDILHLKAF